MSQARMTMKFSKLLIAPAVALVLAGCAKKTPSVSVQETVPADQVIMNETPPTGNTELRKVAPLEGDMINDATEQVVELMLSDYSFTPSKLTAKAGSTLRVKLDTTKGMHDFVIDDLNVQSKTMSSGESDEVVINIPSDAKGKSYEFYCSIMNHRQMGMKGTLVIE